MKERLTNNLKSREFAHDLNDEELEYVKETLDETKKKNDAIIEALWQSGERQEFNDDDKQLLLEGLNEIRQELDLPDVKSEELKIMLLPNESFNQVYSLTGGKVDREADGFVSSKTSYIVIRARENNGYVNKMTAAFHELIHEFVDFEVDTYVLRGVVASRHTGRRGLQVKHWERDTDGEWLKSDRMRGELANELGNHLAQSRFMKSLINSSELAREEFYSAAVRFAQETGQTKIYDRTRLCLARDGIQINISADMVHYLMSNFAEDGTSKFGPQTMLLQLAVDLEELVGTVGGKSFFDAMMEAKHKAETHRHLGARIDEAMGDGFYIRLREGIYGDPEGTLMLDLEVQKKLAEKYGNTGSIV